MNRTPLSPISPLAEFVTRRVDELRLRISEGQIAAAAGFKTMKGFALVKNGTAKLPLEMVADLARALDTSVGNLFQLALEQSLPREMVQVLLGDGTIPAQVRTELEASLVALQVEVIAAEQDVQAAHELLTKALPLMETMTDRLLLLKRELASCSKLNQAAARPG